MWACQGGGAGRCAAKIVRSVPVADGSVKKPTRPQTGPFLGVGKCIPGPLRVRIAPSGAKFSGGELVVRGSAGFFTDPDARGSGNRGCPSSKGNGADEPVGETVQRRSAIRSAIGAQLFKLFRCALAHRGMNESQIGR